MHGPRTPPGDGAGSRYLHGTEPLEQRRLSILNDMLNEASLRELALAGGEAILDVGCGLAQLSRLMAHAAGPGGQVVGVERSPEQIAEALRQAGADGEEGLVELRLGEALELPLSPAEWGSFDVAHARFLLEHVPDPLAVVRRMVAAVRPGGRIVLEDDNHEVMRLWPEPPAFGPLWRGYIRAYDKLGNDPLVGHRLVELLHRAGATPVRNTWIFFGGCAGTASWEAVVENLAGILKGARETMISTGILDPTSFDDGIVALRDWSRRPDAAMWFAISWAEGRRPV